MRIKFYLFIGVMVSLLAGVSSISYACPIVGSTYIKFNNQSSDTATYSYSVSKGAKNPDGNSAPKSNLPSNYVSSINFCALMGLNSKAKTTAGTVNFYGNKTTALKMTYNAMQDKNGNFSGSCSMTSGPAGASCTPSNDGKDLTCTCMFPK